MFYTYVLLSLKDNKLYTGWTDDLNKREIEHNSGKSISTRFRGPFRLIYYEACLNKQDAIKREKALKTGYAGLI